MTVKVTKPEINVREKLSELDKPSGTAGEAMLRAETPQEQFNLIGAGRRNLIINGSMQVSQRGTNFNGITSDTYTLDRWTTSFAGSGNGNWEIEQSTDSPVGFSNSLKMTCVSAITPGTDNYVSFNTRLEGYDLQQTAFGTPNATNLTVSFWVKASKPGNLLFEIYKFNNSKNLVPIYNANTWEYKTFTISGDTAQAWMNSGNGVAGYFNFFMVLGSMFKSNSSKPLGVFTGYNSTQRGSGMTNFGDTNDYVAVTGVQIEAGKIATPFEYRPYAEELALCQRYFQRYDLSHNEAVIGPCTIWDSLNAYGQMPLVTTMRTVPTYSYPGGSNFIFYSGGNSYTVNYITALGNTENAWGIHFRNSSTWTPGNSVYARRTSSNAYIQFDAEL